MEQFTIENYLKAIYHLSQGNKFMVPNKELAAKLGVIPATVTEAVKKLDALKLVEYEKSYGLRLTPRGFRIAAGVVRRHRLWETFLVKELGFKWDEVHDIAEEMEHIDNVKLIEKLSAKLGNPLYDPHGDPIPDEKGKIAKDDYFPLYEAKAKGRYRIEGVRDHSTDFLKYCEKNGLVIGETIQVLAQEAFDGSFLLKLRKNQLMVSSKVASVLVVSNA
jgi:DtxR family Mn-dependent transcriptional regulator